MKKVIDLFPAECPKKFEKSWRKCVGSGNMSLMMRKEAYDALDHVQRDIGFQYVRGHGILSDVMATYQEVPGCRSPFNFTYVDQVYDTFLSHNIRPVVELSFMPEALASGTETIFYWKANISLPASWDKWCACVEGLVRHLIDRYGLEEVLQWPFEVWNEPNFHEFWVAPNIDEYWEMYTRTARTIKSIHSDLMVGGPAADTNGDAYLEEFLTRCGREQVPLDFVSRHAYMSTEPQRCGEFDFQAFHQPDFVVEKLKNARVLMEKTGFGDLPLWITEFNTSYTPKNPIHDTVENAAMIAPVLVKGGQYADAISYWTFCDVFEELGIPRCQFHGGFGLVGSHLIKKPVYRLYEMMSQLEEYVYYQDDNLLITGDGQGVFAILGWNLSGDVLNYELMIPTDYTHIHVWTETLNREAGNPRKVWSELGCPRYPSKSEIAMLEKASQPLVGSQLCTSVQGSCKVELSIPQTGVVLAKTRPCSADLDSYDYMDDERILRWEAD